MDNNQVPQQSPEKGKAIAAMVLGIIACAAAWLGWGAIISLVLGVVGLVLAMKARNVIPEGGDGRSFATAGLILSIIGIVCGGIGLICWICALAAASALSSSLSMYY